MGEFDDRMAAHYPHLRGTCEDTVDVEAQVFHELVQPGVLGLSPESRPARDLIAEKLRSEISAVRESGLWRLPEGTLSEKADDLVSKQGYRTRLAEDPWLCYIALVHDAINSDAKLSPKQQAFLTSLMDVETQIRDLRCNAWEHAAMVATYINSCRE